MARVPVYDAPQVTAQALPGVRVSEIDTGAGLQRAGRGLLEAGNALVARQAVEEEEKNLEAVQRVASNFEAAYLGFNNEAEKRLGLDARGLGEEATKWWRETADTARRELGNDRQLRAFDNLIHKRFGSFHAGIERHEMTQERAAVLKSTEAFINTAEEAHALAIRNGDKAAAAVHLGDIVRSVEATAKLSGLSPEATADLKARAVGAVHTSAVQNLLVHDSDAAKGYFYSNIKEIPASDRPRLEAELTRVGKDDAVFRLVDSVLYRSRGNIDVALEMARDHTDTKVGQAAAAEINRRQVEIQQAEKAQEVEHYGSVRKAVEDNRSWRDIVKSPQYVALSDGKKADAKNYFDTHWNERAAAGRAAQASVKTDPKVYERLIMLPDDTMAKTDLSQDFSKLSESDREFFMRRKADILSGKRKPVEVITAEQQVSNYAKAISDAEQRVEFTKQAFDQFAALQSAGKTPTHEERRRILEDLSLTRNPGMFSSNKPGYRLTPEERRKLPLVIPSADEKRLREFLKGKGEKDTPERMQQLYRQWKLGGK